MFREAVVESKRFRLSGNIVVRAPKIYSTIAVFLFIVSSVALLVLYFFEFKVTEELNGYVTSQQGIVKIFSPQQGVVQKLFHNDGEIVNKGDELVNFLNLNAGNESFQYTPDSIINILKSQKSFLKKSNTGSLALLEIKKNNAITKIGSIKKAQKLMIQRADIENDLLDKLKERFRLIKRDFKSSLVSRDLYEQIEIDLLRQETRVQDLQLQLEDNRRLVIEMNQRLNRYELEILDQKINAKREMAQLDERISRLSPNSVRTIYAPISGRVTSTQVNPGQTPQQGTPLMIITPESAQFWVTLAATDKVIGRLNLGMEVSIGYLPYPSERFGRYKGKIVNISESALSPEESTLPLAHTESIYLVRVELEEQEVIADSKRYLLKPGMGVLGKITIEKISPVRWLIKYLKN